MSGGIRDIDGSAHGADPVTDLADFVTRHRPCGQLTGDATEPAANGYLLTVGCSCGVTFLRWVTPEDAVQELVLSDLPTTAGPNTWATLVLWRARRSSD